MLRADLHVHAFMADALFFFRGRPDEARLARRPGDILSNQVSLRGWREAGIGVAFVALYSPPVLHWGRGHLREILRQAAIAGAFARAHEDRVEMAGTPAEARSIAESGRTALVLAVEGGHGIAGAEDVRALHTAGVRMVTIAHMRDNALAAAAVASHPFEGPNYWFVARSRCRDGSRLRDGSIWRNRNGLTPLGAVAVREMQRLGMIVDLAHSSDRTFEDVLKLTHTDRTPLLSSHTASRALWPSERNIADGQAEAIVARRGAIGVTLWRRLLGVEARRRPEPVSPDGRSFVSGSTDGYIAHFRRLTKVAGAPAVVLGSDLNGMVPRPRATRDCPCGVRNIEDWPALERALVTAGVPSTQLERSADPVLDAWEGTQALASLPTSSQNSGR